MKSRPPSVELADEEDPRDITKPLNALLTTPSAAGDIVPWIEFSWSGGMG